MQYSAAIEFMIEVSLWCLLDEQRDDLLVEFGLISLLQRDVKW